MEDAAQPQNLGATWSPTRVARPPLPPLLLILPRKGGLACAWCLQTFWLVEPPTHGTPSNAPFLAALEGVGIWAWEQAEPRAVSPEAAGPETRP